MSQLITLIYAYKMDLGQKIYSQSERRCTNLYQNLLQSVLQKYPYLFGKIALFPRDVQKMLTLTVTAPQGKLFKGNNSVLNSNTNK